MAETEFLLNYKNILSIDVKGSQSLDDLTKAEWADLLEGINQITPAGGDVVDASSYWADKGFTNSEVTGKNVSFAIAGHRILGDKAQDYVASKFFAIGKTLRTLVKWTDPTGAYIVAKATLTSIVPFGGNANAKQTFSFTLAINGEPKIFPAPTVVAPTKA